ncbi:MAG: type II toxin-antitoxin system mRNA interferase toxin, RelE/StbE family [Candidatus Dojkabacteria bacterium]
MGKYVVRVTRPFGKNFEKLVSRNKLLRRRVGRVFDLLEDDPFYASLKTHKVHHSIYGVMYSSRVTGDVRIIWDFREEDGQNKLIILAIDIGGHDAVYR